MMYLSKFTINEELHNVLNFKILSLVSLRNKLYDEMRKNNRLTERKLMIINRFLPMMLKSIIFLRKKELVDTKVSFYWINYLSQREAITLYYLEERKYDDICGILWVLIISL